MPAGETGGVHQEAFLQSSPSCPAPVAGAPALVSDATVVQENVQGMSSGWSEVQLPTPVSSTSGGLYAMFQLPSGSVCHGEGANTGAGIGYTTGGGLPGWMTADGENWAGLKQGFGLAAQAEVVPAGGGMLVVGQQDDAPVAPPLVTALLPSGPNPFNPRTQLKFSLAEAGPVSLDIYNARGQVVRRLATQVYPAGEHSVTWDGRDGRDQGVASGAYVARFAAGNVVMTARLTLVR